MNGSIGPDRETGAASYPRMPFALSSLPALPTRSVAVAQHPATLPRHESAHTFVTVVNRTTSLVQQRWTADSLSAATIQATHPLVITGAKSTEAPVASGGYVRVQYSLSQAALNRFTDEQAIARLPVEGEKPSFACPVFQRLTDLILPILETPSAFSASFMDQFVRLFCAQVVHTHQLTTSEQQPHRGGLASWQKRRAIEVLSKSAGTPVTLPVVAKECGLSVSHFARSFKITFGLPVHRWVILQRVERAKELLLTSNDCLLQIAFDAGFCDQASFNRTFVKAVGTSPGRWRKVCRV